MIRQNQTSRMIALGGSGCRSILGLARIVAYKALCVLGLITVCQVSARPVSLSAIQAFENEVAAVASDLPGAAAVLVIAGEPRPLMLHGFQSLEDITPVGPKTTFQLASLSKSMAAAALALAVEDNQITWGTPVNELLPDVIWGNRERAKKMRLLHLVSQSSGLWPHAYTNLIEERMTYPAIKSRLNKVGFICDPGSCYSYQNVAFSLIGDMLEKSTGEPFTQYVQARLFAPLGMRQATVGADALSADTMARAHVGSRALGWRPIGHSVRYYKVAPAAGVNASISDMRQWLLAQLGLIEGLSEAVRERLHNRYVIASREASHYPEDRRILSVGYGLGWRTFSFGGIEGFFHHGGYVQGMRSEMIFHPDSASGLVFLTNSEPARLNRLSLRFAEWWTENGHLSDRSHESVGRRDEASALE